MNSGFRVLLLVVLLLTCSARPIGMTERSRSSPTRQLTQLPYDECYVPALMLQFNPDLGGPVETTMALAAYAGIYRLDLSHSHFMFIHKLDADKTKQTGGASRVVFTDRWASTSSRRLEQAAETPAEPLRDRNVASQLLQREHLGTKVSSVRTADDFSTCLRVECGREISACKQDTFCLRMMLDSVSILDDAESGFGSNPLLNALMRCALPARCSLANHLEAGTRLKQGIVSAAVLPKAGRRLQVATSWSDQQITCAWPSCNSAEVEMAQGSVDDDCAFLCAYTGLCMGYQFSAGLCTLASPVSGIFDSGDLVYKVKGGVVPWNSTKVAVALNPVIPASKFVVSESMIGSQYNGEYHRDATIDRLAGCHLQRYQLSGEDGLPVATLKVKPSIGNEPQLWQLLDSAGSMLCASISPCTVEKCSPPSGNWLAPGSPTSLRSAVKVELGALSSTSFIGEVLRSDLYSKNFYHNAGTNRCASRTPLNLNAAAVAMSWVQHRFSHVSWTSVSPEIQTGMTEAFRQFISLEVLAFEGVAPAGNFSIQSVGVDMGSAIFNELMATSTQEVQSLAGSLNHTEFSAATVGGTWLQVAENDASTGLWQSFVCCVAATDSVYLRYFWAAANGNPKSTVVLFFSDPTLRTQAVSMADLDDASDIEHFECNMEFEHTIHGYDSVRHWCMSQVSDEQRLIGTLFQSSASVSHVQVPPGHLAPGMMHRDLCPALCSRDLYWGPAVDLLDNQINFLPGATSMGWLSHTGYCSADASAAQTIASLPSAGYCRMICMHWTDCVAVQYSPRTFQGIGGPAPRSFGDLSIQLTRPSVANCVLFTHRPTSFADPKLDTWKYSSEVDIVEDLTFKQGALDICLLKVGSFNPYDTSMGCCCLIGPAGNWITSERARPGCPNGNEYWVKDSCLNISTGWPGTCGDSEGGRRRLVVGGGGGGSSPSPPPPLPPLPDGESPTDLQWCQAMHPETPFCSCAQLRTQYPCYSYLPSHHPLASILTQDMGHYCPVTCGRSIAPPSPSPPPIENLATLMQEEITAEDTEWYIGRTMPQYLGGPGGHNNDAGYVGADLKLLRRFPWGDAADGLTNLIGCDDVEKMPSSSYMLSLCDTNDEDILIASVTRLCWDEVGFTTSISSDLGRYFYMSGGNTGANPHYLLDGVYPDDGAEDLKTCFVTQALPNAHWTLKFTSKKYFVATVTIFGRAGDHAECAGPDALDGGCGQSRNLTVALVKNVSPIEDADCRVWFMSNPLNRPFSKSCPLQKTDALVDVSGVNEWCWAFSHMVPHNHVTQIALSTLSDSILQEAGFAIRLDVVRQPTPIVLQIQHSGASGWHFSDADVATSSYAVYIPKAYAISHAGLLSLHGATMYSCDEIAAELTETDNLSPNSCDTNFLYARMDPSTVHDKQCMYECSLKGQELSTSGAVFRALSGLAPCVALPGGASSKLNTVKESAMHAAWVNSLTHPLLADYSFTANGINDAQGMFFNDVTPCWTHSELENIVPGVQPRQYQVHRAISGGCSYYMIGKVLTFADAGITTEVEFTSLMSLLPTLQEVLRKQDPQSSYWSFVSAFENNFEIRSGSGTSYLKTWYDIDSNSILYIHAGRIWMGYSYSDDECVRFNPPPPPMPPAPPSPSPPAESPPPSPAPPTTPKRTRKLAGASECTLAVSKSSWQDGGNDICVANDVVADYCADKSRCVRPSNPTNIDNLPQCSTLNSGLFVCKSQINAEFHHTESEVVDCKSQSARAVSLVNGNNAGLGLCEVQIIGRERMSGVPIVLAGKKKIFAKYSPHGFQGFLHFLYDCILRVWWKSKQRWGGSSLPNIPGETGAYKLPQRPLVMQFRSNL